MHIYIYICIHIYVYICVYIDMCDLMYIMQCIWEMIAISCNAKWKISE